MQQEARRIVRFTNPAAATREARPLGILDSYSELSKLVQEDEALLGAYEQQDSTYLLVWIDTHDNFEVLRANVQKVVGYYALTRETAAELAPELKDVPGFLPLAPSKAPPTKKRPKKRANQNVDDEGYLDPKGINIDAEGYVATQYNVAQSTTDDPNAPQVVMWPGVEAEFDLFQSVSTAIQRAAGYTDPVEPGILFLAIAEQGRTQGEVRWAADFLIRELHHAGSARYQQVRSEYLKARGYPPEPRDVQVRALSGALHQTLLRAREIAEATTESTTIHMRHLAAALLLDAQPGPGGVLEVLAPLGADVVGLCDRMLGWVVGYGDDDPEWERLLSSGEPQKRLVAYHADDPKGEDLIGISREVIALATLIAARDIRPPLSVGLFGDWGSGKTFFMRQLRIAIATLSARRGEHADAEGPAFLQAHRADRIQRLALRRRKPLGQPGRAHLQQPENRGRRRGFRNPEPAEGPARQDRFSHCGSSRGDGAGAAGSGRRGRCPARAAGGRAAAR
jgi:hypothetical protein